MGLSVPRRWFPLRKRSMPFLTVDAIIGNQAFQNGRCYICFSLGLDKAEIKLVVICWLKYKRNFIKTLASEAEEAAEKRITLLSVPSKIFCRILLKRIEKAIDSTLREGQAGLRRGRGCMDQIFALRNILEQSLEWNTSLCINFIDFQKAFDSVNRESLWKILQAYGLPPKIIMPNLIKMFYNNFECSIILGNTITEAFPVKSGVRQGCMLSPILFLVRGYRLGDASSNLSALSWNTVDYLLSPSRPWLCW